MIAYFVVTALLLLLASIISSITFVVKNDGFALPRAFAEIAISGWGFWLAYRAAFP